MNDQIETQTTEPSTPGEQYVDAVGKLIRLHNMMILVVFVISLACLGITQYRGGGLDIGVTWWRVLFAVRIILPIFALVVTLIYTSRGMDQAVSERFSNNQIFNLYQRIRLLSMSLLAIAGVVAGLSLVAGNLWWDLVLLILTFVLLVITRPSLVGFVYVHQAIKMQAQEQPGESPETP